MSEDGEDGLPPLVYAKAGSSSEGSSDDGWTKFEDPILFVYAGKGPYVARDLMAFPASLPDDGLIDITIHPMVSEYVQNRRWELTSIVGTHGRALWRDERRREGRAVLEEEGE